MSGSFQKQVNSQPAPAVEGDFCSTNPRYSVNAGPGGIVAGSSLIVGRAAWVSPPLDGDNFPAVANSFGAGNITGILHREQQALFTAYLQETSMQVPAGFNVTLMASADLWVKNNGSTNAQVGQKAYANFADGKFSFAATGAATSGATSTGTIAAETGSWTGSIAGNIMTVAGAVTGLVVPGGILSGTNVITGTQVLSQISGTANGDGTYYVSTYGTVAATTISETYGLFTAVSGLTGTYAVGDVLAGSGGGGVTTGTQITGFGTATGGLGTYYVQTTQAVTSSSITSVLNVETPWIAMSAGNVGDLIKISRISLG